MKGKFECQDHELDNYWHHSLKDFLHRADYLFGLIFLVNQGPPLFQPLSTLLFLRLLQRVYCLCVDEDGWYVINIIFIIHWLA